MHVKELEKGKYRVWIDLEPDYTGKRHQRAKVIKAANRRELNKRVAEWLDSLNTTSNSYTSVSEMCNAVWPQVINNKSPNTVYGYNAALKRINNSIGQLSLEKLTPRAVQQWINDLSKTKSPKTTKDTYSILRLCCSVAVNWEIIKTNPCHDVILPSNKKKEIQILSPEDFATFCAHLDEVPLDYRVCFELALFGSLRRGEIMGIHEDEIPDNGHFYVLRTRYMHRLGQEFIKDTKTASGERLCILPEPVVRDVKALRKYHIEQKLQHGALWKDSEYLIKEPDGEAFHPEQCNKRLQRYMQRIGLEPITFHALRHTYASICISMGADTATVSKRMGHSNVSTTLGIYTHLFEKQSETDKIASALGNMLVENSR